jgi:imidazolonepropionase-like amidohydrolase
MIPHKLRQRALPCIGLALLLAACKPPEQPAVTSIVGAVLLDGTGGPPISDSVVTIENGRIRAVGLRANLPVPPEAEKIDGAGKFVAPAPIDVLRHDAAGHPGYTVVRPGDPDSVLDQARRDRTPLFADILTLRDARTMVDRGVTGCLHMVRDTEAIDPAFIAHLRDLRIVFIPMLAAERNPAQFALAKRNTKRLADGGVPVAIGSGSDPYRELELLVEAGLSPSDVLVAATRNGAAALHDLDHAGTIEPGKRADLLLLSANPVEDIRNLRHAVRVGQSRPSRE